jgi:hypothetical protein
MSLAKNCSLPDFDRINIIAIMLFTLVSGVMTFKIYNKNIYNNNDTSIKKIYDAVNDNNKTIQDKLDELIKTNKKILYILEKQENLLEISKLEEPKLHIVDEYVTEPIEQCKLSNYLNDESSDTSSELANECYDNLPCNNLNKTTRFNSIFIWK